MTPACWTSNSTAPSNTATFEISGRVGSLAGLLNAGAVECDLTGHLGGVQVSAKGTIADLKSLGGADFTADVYGDDLGDLCGLIYLPPEMTGPFRISAAASPADTGVDVHLDATVAGITAKVDGAVDSLVRPKIVDAAVTASGPSIRTVGALTGVADLPEVKFSVSGGVRWEGFPVTIKQLEITVGDSTLSADGILGAPPEMTGSDFSLHGKGPDLSAVGALAGIGLPRESYSVRGRVVRVEEGLEVQDFELRVGSTLVAVDGTVGEPPNHAGTTLSVHAEGPNLALFDRLVGANLPSQAFVFDGRLAQEEQAFQLQDISARIGDIDIRVEGALKTGKDLTGTSLRIDAKGADASQLRALVGLGDLPAEAWSAAGGLDLLDTGLYLKEVSASVGSLRARADGRMGTSRGLVGTDLQLHAEDPDLAHAMPIFGVQGFPEVPIRVEGRLRVEDSGIRLDGAKGTAGDVEVAVDGLIGTPDLDGSIGHLSVRGPQLSSLGVYFDRPDFPAAPFSVEGHLHITNGAFDLGDVVVTVDDNRATINGVLYADKKLIGTDVQVELTAPDLGRAGRLATTLVKLPDLPAESMTLTTHLYIDGAGYEFKELRATLGEAAAKIDGRLGPTPDLVGTNLTVRADGPNASLFSALTGVTVPVAPFKISGRLERTEDLLIFDRVAVRLGGHAVDLHGSLGERPLLIGTDLDLHVSGPGTGLIRDLTGFDKLPDRPFTIDGAFHGTAERFTTENLEITLGESDVKGALEVDIRGKPQVTVRLSSKFVELEGLPSPGSDRDDQGPAPHAEKPGSKAALMFSEKPLDFGWMQHTDADVEISIDTLQMPLEKFHNVQLKAQLVDGRLEIPRLAMAGSRGGSGSGSLVLEPVGDGYRADLSWELDAVRFAAPEEAPDFTDDPHFDVDVRLQAQGASPHELASSSSGSIQIVAGRGVMDNRVVDLISTDILLTLINAFNPFAREDVATELECAVVLLTIDQGVATLEPMALQSNKMTMLGHGKIDLGTEKLNLDWVSKPRKGIGISASMITNPYIKLGGTLAKPSIEIKGVQAIASTGVAVATMGISLVAKGMLDRVTAEKKVCEKAFEEIGRGPETSSKKSRKKR